MRIQTPAPAEQPGAMNAWTVYARTVLYAQGVLYA